MRSPQNHPHALESIYDLFERALMPLRHWLKLGSALGPAASWINMIHVIDDEMIEKHHTRFCIFDLADPLYGTFEYSY